MEMDIAGSMPTSALEPSDHAKQEDPDASSAASVDTGMGMSVETPKVSMMAKVGTNFVIPKNKALVPVTRTTTKWEPLDPKKEELKPLSRKTKWGPDLTEDPVVKRGRALALQTRAEQLAAQLESNNLEIDNNEATRSPSPPPLYDAMGHRMNTREGRKRDQLDVERREAIGECMQLNPSYKPPSGFRPVPKEAKLFIPVKENPGYNFIGLILGPRGNTQKRLEADTGCKITIRGKGSIKDGKTLPYRHGKDNDGTSEDLHVHIAADTFEKVDAAVAIIEPLLIPVDEDRNIYKMKQLRELAEMNGTVRDFIRICTLCGDEGHREWQCPKDKLQTFQAKVICRLCGDGSHPTFDCPLKHSGQGKAIDKEYLSFLEELGVGLGGIDPAAKPNTSSADTSQPMLLTAAGAQPMPSSWMGSESDNASDTGGFPRFPFPFPFPLPPGPQGMNAMNFLPRFFHQAFVGMFRGRPIPPPSLQMMAFMLSAFRGRFPFPPFGLRPNMMRPPMPSPLPPEGTPMDSSTSEQYQASDVVADGAARNNLEPAQNYSESLPPSVGTFDSDEKQRSSVGVPVISSAEGPSFPSSSLPPFLAATASPLSQSPPRFETTTTFPSAGNLVPTFSSVSTPNGLPPEVPSSGYTVPLVTPPLSAVPTFRPVPSVRPVIPPVEQSPSFSHLGGPGLAPLVTNPSWVGSRNISSLSSLDNQSKPSETWTGSATWSQSQFAMEASSTSQLNRPASEYASPQFFPRPNTITPVPPRIDTPYLFNSGESPTLFPTAAGSGPSSFPTLHPPSVSSQFGYLTPRPIPSITPAMPPSITPGLSTSAQGQLGAAIYNQPKDHSLNYSDSRLGPPPAMGSHFRAGDLVTATPPVEDYHPFSSLSERSTFSQQGLSAYSPDAPLSSRLQIAHDYQRGSAFSASDFSYARPQGPLYTGPHLHLESRNVDVYNNAGCIENQELRGTSMTPPSEVFGRSYRYDPSIPIHLLQQRGGSTHEPWNGNSWSISRP